MINTSKDNKRLLDNTLMLFILQISKYVFPLLTFPYLTRVLQPENYGIMTFVSGVMVYFQLLIDFGFLQSATRECSLYRDNKKNLAKTLASTVQARVILGLLGLLIIITLISLLDIFEGKKAYTVLAYISVMLGIFNVDYLFRGLEIMKIITYRTIIARLIYTILIFAFIHTPEQYLYIPIISSFGEIIIIFWTWIYVRKQIGIRVKIVSLAETFSAFKISSMFFLSRIATTAYSSTNTVILGIIYGNSLLAQFGVASALINNIRSLFSPIADSLYPYMVHKKNYGLIKKILYILMPVIFIGTIILYFLAEPIILLMSGEDYTEAIPIFKAFLPLVFITLPVYLLGFPVLGAMNRMKDANMSVIVAAIYHLIGLLLLWKYGAINFVSVAYLTFSTELVVLLYRLICVRRGKLS